MTLSLMKQMIRFDSQVLIYEFDPAKNPSQIIKAEGTRKPLRDFKHTWYRREEGLVELSKINLSTFKTSDPKSIQYGWAYWDSGHEVGKPTPDMITCYLTKPDNKFVVTDSIEKPKQPIWWGISLLFALVIDGKKNLLKAERFAHRNSKVERTMLGQKADGTMVDIWASALTGNEAADLMLELGCVTAVMCDGGQSAQMQIGDKHYGGSRPLGTVLVVMGKEEPKQEVIGGINRIKISENFSLHEFECNDGNNEVKLHTELRDRLQTLRTRLGKAIKVNSGYRTPEHNKAVGGVPNSYHIKGMAADIVVNGMTPKQVAIEARKVGFRGIIVYNTFTHCDVRPNPYFRY